MSDYVIKEGTEIEFDRLASFRNQLKASEINTELFNFIEQGKTLRYENVASFRSKLVASEINDTLLKFVGKLQESGAQQAGPMISVTHGVEVVYGEQMLDIEFLAVINREIKLSPPYRFEEVFELVNCLFTRFTGDPHNIQKCHTELLLYISEQGLQQTTSIYNIIVSDNKLHSNEKQVIDLYVSVK